MLEQSNAGAMTQDGPRTCRKCVCVKMRNDLARLYQSSQSVRHSQSKNRKQSPKRKMPGTQNNEVTVRLK
jgi:hypothetical protein